MAYKIGTRVRVVMAYTAEYRSFIGREGVVTEVWEEFVGARTGYGLDIRPIGIDREGTLSAWSEDQLSPIVPDGHRAGVKGECSLLDELLSREVKSDALVPLPQQSET